MLFPMSQNSKTVRLTQDTMDRLEKVGKPFETPNDCINRVLDGNCVSESKTNNEKTEEEDESES